MNLIDNLPIKNSLLNHYVFSSLKSDVINIIQKIPEIDKLRMSQELVEGVCSIIENLGPSKNSKSNNPIDKKALALEVLTIVFRYTEPEKAIVSHQIDYIYQNDMIVKIPRIKRWLGYIKNWVVKRFL